MISSTHWNDQLINVLEITLKQFKNCVKLCNYNRPLITFTNEMGDGPLPITLA